MRSKWTFKYGGAEVAAAAQKRAAYHRERLEFWKVEAEKAEARLREKGVEFRTYPITGGEQLNVMLDPDLQKRLQECKAKIRSHEESASGFDIWVAACSRVEGELELDCDDIAFFGL